MRQVLFLGGLLAVSLVASYQTWTAPEEKKGAIGVPVIEADDESLSSVAWKDETTDVLISRKKDAAGAWFWVDVTETPKPKEAPPGEPPAAAPEASSSHFLGNESAQEVWDGFTPLLALRELQLGPDADLVAYGLDTPKGTIEVKKGAESFKLEVGGESFGTKDRYVRYNGKVYLLDDKFLRPLQFAKARLVERRLFPLEDKAVTGVDVVWQGKSRSFVQKNVDDAAKTFWADKAAADKKDSEAGTWIGKLLRVRLKSYVADSELKGEPVPVFQFNVTGDNKTWKVLVGKVGEGAEAIWYAKGDFTRSWVELTRSLAEDPADDLAQLFDGQEAPEEPEAPEAGAPSAGGGPPGAPAGMPGAPPMPPGAPPMPPGASPKAPAGGPPPAGAPKAPPAH